MKVIILAGGRGTRLRGETHDKPKPMVEVGNRPILWHILKHFAYYGFGEFLVALGYKGEVIKNYFLHYQALQSDFSVHLGRGEISPPSSSEEDWVVHLVDTGLETNTGGRILRLRSHIGNETFMVTYGDGVSDVDLRAVVAFHKSHGKTATLTAVRPATRFGALELDEDDSVLSFHEKPEIGPHWVNGGYLVFEPSFFDYLEGDDTGLDVLARVAEDGQLAAYRHHGFWQCLDYFRDRERLEKAWSSGSPPWKVWE